MAIELRKTGISVVGDLPWGAHFCYFYETKQDLLDILIPYFKTGLENKEFCLWVISNSELLTVEEATSELRNALPDLDRYVAERSIEVVGHDDWFLSGKTFDPHNVANRFKEKLSEALARGYAGMRVNGSPAWLHDAGPKELRKFEAELDKLFPNERTIASCTYPLASVGGDEIFDVVRTHQFAIARRQGEWEIIETPELIQAKAEIKSLNEELEQRVIERTKELVAANEALKSEIDQRRRVEEELRERAAELAEAQRVAKIGNWIFNLRTNKLTWSEELYRIFEIEKPDFDGRYESFVSRIHPDDQPRVLGTNAQTRTEGSPFDIEYRIITPNDQVKIIREVGYATKDEAGQVIRLFGTAQDITERKQAEEKLKQSETQLAEAQRLASVGSWNWDIRKNNHTWSDELYHMYGLHPQESSPSYETFIKLVHPDDRAVISGAIEHALNTQEPINSYLRIIRPDGAERIIHSRGNTISDISGTPTRMHGTVQDVTERRQAEDALHEAERKYRDIFENAGEGIFQSTPDGRFISANPALALMHGFASPGELIHSRQDISRQIYVDPTRRDEFKRLLEEQSAVRGFEHQVFRKDGSKIWISVNARAVRDEQGGIQYYEGTAQDVTQRKLVEKELGRSEEMYRSLVEQAPDAIFIAAPDLHLIDPNARACELSGYTRDEILQMSIPDFIPPEDILSNPLRLKELQEGKTAVAERRLRRKDGTLVPVEVSAKFLGDGRLQAIVRDITERKRAEEALRESEERYRDLVENSRELICTHDLDGLILSANRAATEVLGHDREDYFGKKNLREILTPEALEGFEDYLARIRNDGVASGIMLVQTSSGEHRIWEYYNTLRTEGVGAPIVRGMARDITDRRQAEEALQESEERYRELFENAKDATYVHDLSGRYTSINRAAEKLSGYSREEILGKNVGCLVAPEYLEHMRENLSRKLRQESETTYEVEVITKDGRRVPVELSSRLILENRVPVGVQGTARDITERKAAEEKLKGTSEQLRALSARLQSAREEEGARIAREIHDELGSALTSLKWDLEGTDRILASPLEASQLAALRERLRALMKLTDLAISAIRRIASELRPSVLDDLGLGAAIEWQAQQFQARTGIVCYCDCSLEKVELSEEQSTAVFRILQEALTNVLRHAQATRVDIKLNKENSHFVLSVSDNGQGITERQKSEPRSLGILGMRERAHLIGAEIDIKGIAGKGTVVIVRVPMSGQDRVLKMTR